MRFRAWWSFFIRAHSRRRLKIGPWREIQSLLGTSLGRFVFTGQRSVPGTYHVEADLLIEAPDPASAAVALHQLARRLGGNWHHAWHLDEAPDEFEPTIAAFYKVSPAELLVSAITSAGVQLDALSPDGTDRSRVPVLTIDDTMSLRRNFILDFAISIEASQKKKLLEMAWPTFSQRFAGPVAIVEFEPRPGETGPFCFTARQNLDGVTDAEAAAACLRQTGGMILSFERDEDGQLVRLAGTRADKHAESNQITAFAMRLV